MILFPIASLAHLPSCTTFFGRTFSPALPFLPITAPSHLSTPPFLPLEEFCPSLLPLLMIFICDLLAILSRIRSGLIAFWFRVPLYTTSLVLFLSSLTSPFFPSSTSPSICFFFSLHSVITPSNSCLSEQHSVSRGNKLSSDSTPFLSVHLSHLFDSHLPFIYKISSELKSEFFGAKIWWKYCQEIGFACRF